MDEIESIVIDNGTCRMRAGFAGDESPRSILRSLIGHPRLDAISINFGNNDVYIGDEALEYACISSLKYPIEHGIVKNWDDMEKLYDFIFKKELQVDPEEHPILLTDAPLNPRANREKMIQIMFETFNVPSFYVGIQSHLSLNAFRRTTGLVCDVGDGVTQILPVYEGYFITSAIRRANFAGQDIIDHLQRIFTSRGYNFTTSEEKEILRDIVEKHGLVSLDYEGDLKKCKTTPELDTVYTLPDGNCITISDERFLCTEILFNPGKEGYEFDGVHKMICDSINDCDQRIHKDLYTNIVATGGVSLVEGFFQRLANEINEIPFAIQPKIVTDIVSDFISSKYRLNSAFVGGSILASVATFPQMVITHDEYNDAGPRIVHRKCP